MLQETRTPDPRRATVGLVLVAFALLVAFQVHGSSILLLADDPTEPNYVFEPLGRLLTEDVFSPDHETLRKFLLMTPRAIRSDEYAVSTAWAWAQAAHDPPFPVVNEHIGVGQNMLLSSSTPVAAPSALARPITWGYLLFSPGHGLAWAWWFPVLGCFLALYLLLFEVLQRDHRLALFGAFWFCLSAYCVAWSFSPAHTLMFPLLLCLCVYYLLQSERRHIQIASGLGTGLALAAMAMNLYPPWLVPLGYLAVVLLVGMLVQARINPLQRLRDPVRIASMGTGLLIAGWLIGSFLADAWPAMQAISATEYPGHRFSTGGDGEFSRLFRGFFNYWTNDRFPHAFGNHTEAASYFLLLPAVLSAVLLTGRARKNFGVVGWLVLTWCAVLLWYMFVGFPDGLSRITLFSYVTSVRLDLTLGLCAILLCTILLNRLSRPDPALPPHRWHAVVAAIVMAGTVLATVAGFDSEVIPLSTASIVIVCLLASAAGYALVAGMRRAFMGIMIPAILLTGAFFNPLSRGVEYLDSQEVITAVRTIDREQGYPLWLSYGDDFRDNNLLPMAGARNFSCTHYYPQWEIWQHFDLSPEATARINRYAHVMLAPAPDDVPPVFENPAPDQLRITISPRHAAFRELGSRLVLGFGSSQKGLRDLGLPLLYESSRGRFSIFRLDTGSERPN